MKRSIIITILLIVLNLSAFTQETASPVKWYSITDIEMLNKKEPRPIFIDTYTDWCGWCKKMDRETFTNSVISDILNNKYYAVKFNAEVKEDITIFGQKFINDGKAGNAHQLAVALLKGQLSYPTVVFLIPQADGRMFAEPVPGYREAKDMEKLLSFFAEKAFTKQSWDEYQKTFQGKVK